MPESLWDLKETAKWARNPGEKKAAIKTLSARGEEALPLLEEILAITAYDDIRAVAMEAIRSVREKENPAEKEKSSGTAEKSKADAKKDTAAGASAAEKSKGSSKLADLPP
ncbi:hypothetical protein [Nitrososphaera viennensis]|uniref:HEAT repeat domain-containing protein n=2 Tax=Nitrososphaera viennensis TaxID=1034015 RepID=A0A060HTX4_9ARCH|nr:hypothetical protein [Nitrososphaera viennensis]AIC16881.1 hypothetical protein NVIE_026100 [Nitrososphaera viennensis EN76]UVS68784.1 hypothetical protein NWT39_12865 [Nitrososphaera viennensis]